ncbi:MAG: hypothetical protein V4773_29470 [Verrucomicrobiota bacterium]
MHLQPLATTCFVSGEPFVEGARVASFLMRSGAALEIVRYDVLEAHLAGFTPEGQLACRWVQAYKPRKIGENADRALKLTTENLFVTLADPTTEPTPENTRLLQFLALMLERKKVLRPRGRSKDGARNLFEHAKSKQMFEIPAGELTPEFFVAVQEQLSVLVGVPKTKEGAKPVVAAAAGAATPAPAIEPAVEPAGAPETTLVAMVTTETSATDGASAEEGQRNAPESPATPSSSTEPAQPAPLERVVSEEMEPTEQKETPVASEQPSQAQPDDSTRGGSGGTAAA